MDITNPAVLDYMLQTYLAPAIQQGYQGIFFDNVNVENKEGRCGIWRNGQWIQQFSGNLIDQTFINSILNWAQSMQTQLHALNANISWNWQFDHNDPTDSLKMIQYVDFDMDERGFNHWGNISVSDSYDQYWLANMQAIQTLQSQGKAYMSNNYEWVPDANVTRAELQWAVANYLLIKDKHTYLHVNGTDHRVGTTFPGTFYQGLIYLHSEYFANIGHATNAMYQSQGVWMRDYSSGKTIVNPSSTQTFTVNLPANTYHDLYGNAINQPIPMATATGMVLLNFNIPIPSVPPTNTPVPSSHPSPTSSLGGTTLSLTSCPHGLGNCGDNANPTSSGNMSPKHAQRTVNVTLLDANNQPVTTTQGTVNYVPSVGNFQGTVSLGTVANGNYLVKIKTDGYLPKQAPGIITIASAQTIMLPSVSLVTGDINNDGQLDILDYNILIGCFGSKQTTSSCTMPPTTQAAGADINDDGVVNGSDYNLFLRELSVQRGG